jgi:predicted transcriptional regulator
MAKATSIKLDDELKGRVQHLAEARRRSSHWIMREAIAQYVEREEARESVKQEALASWTAYKETGRHLTGEEVRAWLNTWGTDDERAVPECHE